MGNSVYRKPTAEIRMSRPWLIAATLLFLTAITFSGGTACAGSSGPDVGEIAGSSGLSLGAEVGPSVPSVSEMALPHGTLSRPTKPTL